jgi:hypothetical protein
MQRVGWLDFRVVDQAQIAVDDTELAALLEGINFFSQTIRAIKTDLLEDRCEQYGQVVQYLGNMPYHTDSFKLDDSHVFKPNVPVPVCGNTAAMIQDSRYAKYFSVMGNRSLHYGLFPDCSPADNASNSSSSCC